MTRALENLHPLNTMNFVLVLRKSRPMIVCFVPCVSNLRPPYPSHVSRSVSCILLSGHFASFSSYICFNFFLSNKRKRQNSPRILFLCQHNLTHTHISSLVRLPHYILGKENPLILLIMFLAKIVPR